MALRRERARQVRSWALVRYSVPLVSGSVSSLAWALVSLVRCRQRVLVMQRTMAIRSRQYLDSPFASSQTRRRRADRSSQSGLQRNKRLLRNLIRNWLDLSCAKDEPTSVLRSGETTNSQSASNMLYGRGVISDKDDADATASSIVAVRFAPREAYSPSSTPLCHSTVGIKRPSRI